MEFIYGSFPWSYWNGNINSNYGNVLPMYAEFSDCIHDNMVPICFDFSNANLEKFDFFDRHMNTVLDLFKDNGSYIEITNIEFIDLIKSKYPYYKFILSRNAILLNQDINKNDFEMVQLLPIDNEIMQTMKNKNKYQIVIGLKNNYLDLIQDEQLNQISFSAFSNFNNCKSKHHIDLALEIKKYAEMGYSHFVIDAPSIDDLDNFNNQLCELLFIPEFLKDIQEQGVLL